MVGDETIRSVLAALQRSQFRSIVTRAYRRSRTRRAIERLGSLITRRVLPILAASTTATIVAWLRDLLTNAVIVRWLRSAPRANGIVVDPSTSRLAWPVMAWVARATASGERIVRSSRVSAISDHARAVVRRWGGVLAVAVGVILLGRWLLGAWPMLGLQHAIVVVAFGLLAVATVRADGAVIARSRTVGYLLALFAPPAFERE